MSEPIKAGDLVVVVRTLNCCDRDRGALGKIFTVEQLIPATKFHCQACLAVWSGNNTGARLAVGYNRAGDPGSWPLTFLIKINPPALDETHDTSEELTA